tara:strand:+ start:3214 stop:3753 length:540 start_codon:yes stop_codon:yes gene_type:complete
MNFIDTFDNTLTDSECDTIIQLFESDNRKTAPVHNARGKISTDINAEFGEDEYTLYNNIIFPKLCNAKNKYVQKYPILDSFATLKWDLLSLYRIQRYLDGEGYHQPHCEHGKETPPIIMTWTMYLNDAECGTKYVSQELVVPAVKGSCCIAPAFWTHVHHGVTPNIGTKYIATGWWAYS